MARCEVRGPATKRAVPAMTMISPEDALQLMPTYDRLRAVGRGLNDALIGTLSQKTVEEAARALGFWERGKVVFQRDADADSLADHAIYDVRAGGKNAVERFSARTDTNLDDADAQTVLRAMRDFRFTLAQVTERIPGAGIVVSDLLYSRSVVILDRGLGETGSPPLLLATRLLSFDGWSMTSGIALPLDPDIAAMFFHSIGAPAAVATASRSALGKLAAKLIVLALADPEELTAEWRRLADRRARSGA